MKSMKSSLLLLFFAFLSFQGNAFFAKRNQKRLSSTRQSDECLTLENVQEIIAEQVEASDSPIEDAIKEVQEVAAAQAIDAVSTTIQAVENNELPPLEEGPDSFSDGEQDLEDDYCRTDPIADVIKDNIENLGDVAEAMEVITTGEVVEAFIEAVKAEEEEEKNQSCESDAALVEISKTHEFLNK